MRQITLKYRFEISIFLIYLFLAIVLTFPLVIRLGNSLYGYTADNFSGAWYFWWLKYAASHHLNPGFTSLVGAPFGTTYGVLTLEDFWIKPVQLLTGVFNQFAAFNLVFLFSFPFTGLAMYFLTLYLTKNRLASFWAGLVFSFAPYHFWQGYAHLSLALIYTLPTYILSLFYFADKKSYRSAIFLASAFLFIFLTTFYYGLFAIIFTICFLGMRTVLAAFKKQSFVDTKLIKSGLVFGILVSISLIPYLIKFYLSNYAKGAAVLTAIPNRGIDDFLSLSLRPWDLFLPAPDHPFLGNLSQALYKFISHLGKDYKTISAFLPERVVYLGLTTFFFWSGSIYLFWKKKIKNHHFWFLVVLTGLVFLLALPPFLAFRGHNFYLPSFLIYKTVPQLRVLVRLGIVILLLSLVVASFGVSYIINRLPFKKRLIFVTLISVFSLIEFLPLPPSKVTAFDNPPQYYKWVKNLPADEIVAEYPKKFDMADALIWQTYHGKKLFNMFQGEYYQLWDNTAQLSSEMDTDILASLGVKYVIFHTKYLYEQKHPFDELFFTRFADPPTLDKTKNIDVKEFPWLKLVKEYSDARIYQLRETDSKFADISPTSGNQINFVNGTDWRIHNGQNYFYFYNFSGQNKEVLFDYENFPVEGSIVNESYRVETPNLKGAVLKVKAGLNIIGINIAGLSSKQKINLVLKIIK